MDLNQIPERERIHMMKLIEEKQAKQFMNLYGFVVSRCFNDCANEFQSEALSGKEKECIKRCTGKLLKATNKIGTLMAEKQQMQQAVIPTSTPINQ